MIASLLLLGMIGALATLLVVARFIETNRLQAGAVTYRLIFPVGLDLKQAHGAVGRPKV